MPKQDWHLDCDVVEAMCHWTIISKGLKSEQLRINPLPLVWMHWVNPNPNPTPWPHLPLPHTDVEHTGFHVEDVSVLPRDAGLEEKTGLS